MFLSDPRCSRLIPDDFQNHVFLMIFDDFLTSATWRKVLRTPLHMQYEVPQVFGAISDGILDFIARGREHQK